MLDRDKLIHTIADSACDGIDLKDLLRFYYDSQCEWCDALSDQELIEHAEDYLCDFEEEDYQMDKECDS